MAEKQRLAILKDGKELSHLSVRLDEPRGKPRGCFVFCHGFGSDQDGEKALFFRERALAEDCAFCTFDFQGHGASGGTLRALTISRNLSDLYHVHEFLKSRGHERLFLIGSSMGGFTGIWYAALHPAGVAAGLHIAPAFGMDEGFLAWAGEARAAKWEREGAIAYRSDYVSCELGWEWIADLRAHETVRLLGSYKTPTLILQGKNDEAVPWRGVVNFATRCEYEGIDVHLFADGDHRLTDRKDRLWALMLEFLQGRALL